MNNIVEVYENELRVSHRVIAEQTNNQVVSVQNLITGNIKELEEFGHLHFKNETVKNTAGAVNEAKTYYLNEPQATLLMTFMRNSEVVKKFKISLVKEFYRMKNYLKSDEEKMKLEKDKAELEKIKTITAMKKEAIKRIDTKTAELQMQIVEKQLNMIEKLNAKGFNFDPTSLVSSSAVFDTNLKDKRAEFGVVFNEVRFRHEAYSAKSLLKDFNSNLSVIQFNKLLIRLGLLEEYTYKGIKHKKLSNDNTYYGYNQPYSSKTKLPYDVLYYEDRFRELLKLTGKYSIENL